MDSWKDQGYHFVPEVTRTRFSSYRKPPIGSVSNWQQTVPSWEKKFCSSVGSISWNKLLESKKTIHLYDNIIKWNDSAGKEAFDKAKNNFYANMHNLPSDNGSPDADIYIDNVNWDSEVDQNLMLDLDSDYVVPDSNSKDEQVVIFGSSFPPSYQSFSPYGWGDSDDDEKKKRIESPYSNLHQQETERGGFDKNDNWRASNENNGCGDSRNDYWGWNMYDDNNCFYDDVKNEPKERSGRYMSRYKTTRFQKDTDRAQNNGSRRKSSYSCAHVKPSSHAHRWNVKKPVS